MTLPRPFIADLDDLPIRCTSCCRWRSTGAVDQGAVHVHCDQPGVSGRVHVLHQARELPVQCAAEVAGADHGGAVEAEGAGINNIHMYADLFTVNREQVMELASG